MRFLPAVLMVLCLAGCSLDDVREGAAQRSCTWSDKCGHVGAGESYESFSECLTSQRSSWQSVWPTDTCKDHLDGDAVNTCYRSITEASCGDFVDQLNVISDCNSNSVCSK